VAAGSREDLAWASDASEYAASSGRIESVPIATLKSSDLQIGGKHGVT